ncbi:hypothetical protein MSAN_01607200 [Mycena sanguinolenta]|uniref:Uncharacterized protein n=1 Tax=Mycena sanguinolenta TaxID=230812 RepID=A0A8H6Y4X0_9AGAR|nr:hypothetical protein MSAN_01607200 [Mycena sanguinolenta]
MATALTAEQVQLHAAHLASTTDFKVFPLLVETALYAMFTILIMMSTYFLTTRGLRSRSSKVMLAVTLVMYGLSTYDWAIDIHLLRDDLKVFLPADLIQPPPDHTRRTQVNNALHISQSIVANISTMLSDTVVCWRVYIVYGRSKRVFRVATFFLTALFCAISLCNLTQIGIAFPSVHRLHILAPGELIIDIVALMISALVNIWATLMITYQAWQCRLVIRHYLKDTDNRTFAESMLALFAESGTIYTILWILKNIIIIPRIEPTSYTDYATVVMYQMTGMYPTVIIILVALKKSHLEHQFTSYGDVTTQHTNIQVQQGMMFAQGTRSSAAETCSVIVLAPDSSTELGSSKEEDKESEV